MSRRLAKSLLLAALAAAPAAPDLQELLALVMRVQDVKLDSKRHRFCDGRQTVGDYLAALVARGSQGDAHSLTGRCGAYDPKRSPVAPYKHPEDVWECHVSAYTVDKAGQSPWRYELDVLVSKRKRAADPDHMACPGLS